MEILGAVASGVTLSALFKYSFEALDLIQLYQTQDVDFNRLQLQFKLEKCRLYNWGVEMGLADDSKQNLLSEWHSRDLVSETLREVINLFCDGQIIRKKYGCDDTAVSAGPSLPPPECSHGITSAFDHFKIKSYNASERISRLQKTKWVIRDRNKFLLLIAEVRGLIDSLERITNDLSSIARLEEFLRIRITGIANADTLLGIASVWKESHPRVASAASTKADSISTTSPRREFISKWQAMVASEASGDTLVDDIEDLTITELKHSVVSRYFEVEALKETLDAAREECRKSYLRNQDSSIHQARELAELASIQRTTRITFTIIGALIMTDLFAVLANDYRELFPWKFKNGIYENVFRYISCSLCMAIWLNELFRQARAYFPRLLFTLDPEPQRCI